MDALQTCASSRTTTSLLFGSVVALVASVAFAVSCSDPTSSKLPTVVPKDTLVASIEAVWPTSLLVNQ